MVPSITKITALKHPVHLLSSQRAWSTVTLFVQKLLPRRAGSLEPAHLAVVLAPLHWHHWDQVPMRNLQCDRWWIASVHVSKSLLVKSVLQDIVSNYFYWEQIICEPSGFGTFPDSETLMFQISVSGETMHISLLAFSAPPLPLNVFYPPVTLGFYLCLCVSHFSFYWIPTNHFLSLLLLLTSSLLQSSLEGINQP